MVKTKKSSENHTRGIRSQSVKEVVVRWCYRVAVFLKFSNFAGKHLQWSPFSFKFAGPSMQHYLWSTPLQQFFCGFFVVLQNNTIEPLHFNTKKHFLSNIFLFNVNNRNTSKRCEICSKLTIMIPKRRYY